MGCGYEINSVNRSQSAALTYWSTFQGKLPDPVYTRLSNYVVMSLVIIILNIVTIAEVAHEPCMQVHYMPKGLMNGQACRLADQLS